MSDSEKYRETNTKQGKGLRTVNTVVPAGQKLGGRSPVEPRRQAFQKEGAASAEALGAGMSSAYHRN